MGLKIYQGQKQANRNFENTFFRAFASNLKEFFDKNDYEGTLLGHPFSRDDRKLKPDSLLITEDSIVIVDFKNFDNQILQLPSEANFEKEAWFATDKGSAERKEVQGGSAPNPFSQLQRQKEKLQIILRKIGIRTKIFTIVLFQGDVVIQGKIPGKFQHFFSIANEFDYINVIQDDLNIQRDWPGITNIDDLVNRFNVREFSDIVAVNLEQTENLAQLSEAKRRHYQAERDAVEQKQIAQEEYLKAKKLGQETDSRKKALDNAIIRANNAQKAAAQISKEFEKVKSDVLTAQAKAEEARANADRAKTESETQLANNKTKKFITLAVTFLITLAVIFPIVWFSVETSQRNDAAQKTLAEEMKLGVTCIPLDKVDQFIGEKGVCVTFVINYVNESTNFVFLNDKTYGSFTALVRDKSILTLEEAKEQFLYKKIEVRGDISIYDGTAQINVYEKSQLKIIDD